MADVHAFGELIIVLCADTHKIPADKRQALNKVHWDPLQALANRWVKSEWGSTPRQIPAS